VSAFEKSERALQALWTLSAISRDLNVSPQRFSLPEMLFYDFIIPEETKTPTFSPTGVINTGKKIPVPIADRSGRCRFQPPILPTTGNL
jgi:hypothetical protein